MNNYLRLHHNSITATWALVSCSHLIAEPAISAEQGMAGRGVSARWGAWVGRTERFARSMTSRFRLAGHRSILSWTFLRKHKAKEILCKPILSNPKPGHTTGGTRRGGAQRRGGRRERRAMRGGAGWDGGGRMHQGRRRDDAPRGKPSTLLSRAPKTTVLDVFSEARTKEILCKRTNSGSRNTTSR